MSVERYKHFKVLKVRNKCKRKGRYEEIEFIYTQDHLAYVTHCPLWQRKFSNYGVTVITYQRNIHKTKNALHKIIKYSKLIKVYNEASSIMFLIRCMNISCNWKKSGIDDCIQHWLVRMNKAVLRMSGQLIPYKLNY